VSSQIGPVAHDTALFPGNVLGDGDSGDEEAVRGRVLFVGVSGAVVVGSDRVCAHVGTLAIAGHCDLNLGVFKAFEAFKQVESMRGGENGCTGLYLANRSPMRCRLTGQVCFRCLR
jgi:hypothetical protein